MQLWIIIPAYNEEDRIKPTLRDYSKAVWLSGISSRIVVVSDSVDKTDKIVTKFSKQAKNVKLIKNKVRKGKGYAIIMGFKYAMKNAKHNSLIGFVDADDAVTAKEYGKMVKILLDENADGIIASRYTKGSKTVDLERKRVLASRGYNLLARALFGIGFNDTQCGAKIFRYDALKRVVNRVILTGAGFDLNILYELKRQGAKIVETGITYVHKKGGTTNKNFLLSIIRLFLSTLYLRAWYFIHRGEHFELS